MSLEIIRPSRHTGMNVSYLLFRLVADYVLFVCYKLRWCFFPLSHSTQSVEPQWVTLYLTFEAKRISSDFSFLHAPPPRHLRLAWPSTESIEGVQSPEAFLSSSLPISRPGQEVLHGSDGEGQDTTLALCTMFKNEAPYLEEWLQYHRLLGVSKVCSEKSVSTDRS